MSSEFVGRQEVEELFKLCKKKSLYLGATLDPLKSADDLKGDKEPANLVLLISSDKPILNHVILSDKVTLNLAVTATFLLEELKGL